MVRPNDVPMMCPAPRASSSQLWLLASLLVAPSSRSRYAPSPCRCVLGRLTEAVAAYDLEVTAYLQRRGELRFRPQCRACFRVRFASARAGSGARATGGDRLLRGRERPSQPSPRSRLSGRARRLTGGASFGGLTDPLQLPPTSSRGRPDRRERLVPGQRDRPLFCRGAGGRRAVHVAIEHVDPARLARLPCLEAVANLRHALPLSDPSDRRKVHTVGVPSCVKVAIDIYGRAGPCAERKVCCTHEVG